LGLKLIATPIGNEEDITLRALKALKNSECIIGEELKILRRRLSAWNVPFREKNLLTLNEHSQNEDIKKLLELCINSDVCLVTDCGTPSFFDPGFELVKLCHEEKVSVESFPGVSSLTALIPFLPVRTQRFNVMGFPPQKDEQRAGFFQSLKKENAPMFIMDTPYRLKKTMTELMEHLPNSQVVLGINLTCENEMIVLGTPRECLKKIEILKKENFVLMIYPRGF
jgi:16S rRNA (cytidine1402-2'-O)-methyltransferase